MSHSPLERRDVPSEDPYAAGWTAVIRLARSGQSWSGHERNCCFLNLPSASTAAGAAAAAPRFVDVAGALGADFDDDGRAAARIDLDHDGDEDLVVNARTSPRLRLLVNRVADGVPHVALDVVGTRANRDGIGARVTVTPLASNEPDAAPLSASQVKERRAGEGYLAQSSATQRFGLGRGARAARVTVCWPGDPTPEDFGVVAPGRRYRLVQGRGRAAEVAAPDALRLPAGGLPPEPPIREARRIVLTAPRAIPSLPASDAQGRTGRLFGATPEGPRGTGRTTLVLVWASWCAPCLAELAAFEAARDALAGAGLDVVALGADGPEGRAAAAAALARVGWRGHALAAEPEALEVLDAVLEDTRFRPTRMPLPTAFLFDPAGALAVVYVGGVTPEVARADLPLSTGPIVGRADLATPFPGRWRVRPDADIDARRLPSATLDARLSARGLDAARRELELARATTRRADAASARLAIARARMQQGTPEALTQALELYEAVLAEEPGQAEALRNRAILLSALERVAEAADAWRAVVERDPANPDARFSLGLALVAAGDLEGAAREGAWLRAEGSERARAHAERLDEIARKVAPRPPKEEAGGGGN